MTDALTSAKRQEIIDAIYSQRKIEAIKLYRQATGIDLKGSKEFVDKLEAALRTENPDAFQNVAASTGCGAAALLMLATPAALYWIL
ncbi:ribosomal protein L7/L12 [Planctomicrobium sp. SH661]|uniref:ribosomal protein L7/L12 n=1 Tax=Planctomicrobium sp. SH661 TaxID=3448124 RepID=UPI003F5B9CA2